MSTIGHYIELPLRFIQWLLDFILNYLLLIVVIAACSYMLWRVYKWRFRGNKKQEPSKQEEEPYWQKYIR